MLLSTHTANLEQLADRIAECGFCIIDNFLDDTSASALAHEARSLKQTAAMNEAGIGREHLAINKSIRGDSIYWLNETGATEAQQSYFKQMEDLRLTLNRQLYLGLFGLECHLAIYPTGAFYKRHLDCFATQSSNKPQRKISCIVYLNHEWRDEDGGKLRLYLNETDELNQEKSIDVSPLAGRAVVFLSDTFYHEVLPASKERISLTGWFFTRA